MRRASRLQCAAAVMAHPPAQPKKMTIFWISGARFGYASGSASFACDDCLEPLPHPPPNAFGAYRAFAPCLMRLQPLAGVPSLI